jgi:hypothetical protein
LRSKLERKTSPKVPCGGAPDLVQHLGARGDYLGADVETIV